MGDDVPKEMNYSRVTGGRQPHYSVGDRIKDKNGRVYVVTGAERPYEDGQGYRHSARARLATDAEAEESDLTSQIHDIRQAIDAASPEQMPYQEAMAKRAELHAKLPELEEKLKAASARVKHEQAASPMPAAVAAPAARTPAQPATPKRDIGPMLDKLRHLRARMNLISPASPYHTQFAAELADAEAELKQHVPAGTHVDADSGLHFRRDGKNAAVTGNTFAHKDALKRSGFRWDGDARAWVGPIDAVRKMSRDAHSALGG